MPEPSVHTSRPLNMREDRDYQPRALTFEEREELTAWFAHLTVNEDPDSVLPPPNCYKATAAWLQMQGIGIISEEHKPWTLPRSLVEHYADVWYANRKGVLLALEQQKREALAEAAGQKVPRSPLFGDRDHDPRTGRA